MIILPEFNPDADLTPIELELIAKKREGWVGVDFDGTLVEYNWHKDQPPYAPFGRPIKPMIDRVSYLIEKGVEVKIFTARMCLRNPQTVHFKRHIDKWILENFGPVKIDYTNRKDHRMALLLDDNARQVIRNTGEVIHGRFTPSPTYQACGVTNDPLPPEDDGRINLPKVFEILRDGAKTFESRDKEYGSAYKKFGHIINALFPDGLHVDKGDISRLNQIGVLFQIVGKIARFCSAKNGHIDSAHDSMVYSAMLEELTRWHQATTPFDDEPDPS